MLGDLRVGFSQVQLLKPDGYLLENFIGYKESERKRDWTISSRVIEVSA